MGLRRVAIVGAGMTKFVRRALETPRELAYEAARMALDSCELSLKDIDCVTIGSAPDAFDGVHMKGEYLSDGSGAYRKPVMRHFVGGGTGCFSPIHGWFHVASGMFDTCLVVAEEKMSSCHPHPAGAFLTIFDHTTEQTLYPTLIWIFAIEMHRYMHTYSITKMKIALVAVKNKKNALDHPAAQIPEEITVEDVLNSEVMAYPVNRLDISPTSDGAAAMVLAAEHVARGALRTNLFGSMGWATAWIRPTGALGTFAIQSMWRWRQGRLMRWRVSGSLISKSTLRSPTIHNWICSTREVPAGSVIHSQGQVLDLRVTSPEEQKFQKDVLEANLTLREGYLKLQRQRYTVLRGKG